MKQEIADILILAGARLLSAGIVVIVISTLIYLVTKRYHTIEILTNIQNISFSLIWSGFLIGHIGSWLKRH